MARRKSGASAAFTLVEMLVAVAVLIVIMFLAAQMVAATGKMWKNVSAKIDAFQASRDGFQMMTDLLRQATLNTYWDYFDPSGYTIITTATPGSFSPVTYGRQSELHFISGLAANNLIPNGTLPNGAVPLTDAVFFQSPLDFNQTASLSPLNKLLNATGFYVEFGPDYDSTVANMAMAINGVPVFTTLASNYAPRYRFRLMQLIQPTENFLVYQTTSGTTWYTSPLAYTSTSFGTTIRPDVRIVADNIIGLFIWPKINGADTPTLTTNFNYDSRNKNSWTPGTGSQPLNMNQLPPLLEVAMIALDEPSAKVLQGGAKTQPAQITAAYASSNPSTGVQFFTVPQNMDSDLEQFDKVLAAIQPKLNFRIFSTTLAIKSAKFSTK